MNTLVKERQLTLNREKSVVVTMGTRGQKELISKEIQGSPLLCGEVSTKEVEVWKWLGQHLSGGGLADSVAQTVAAREGKVRGVSAL